MNKKGFAYFVFALLLFVYFASFASSQLEGVEGQIEGAVGNIEDKVDKVNEFTEKDKWDFIGAQWKELLLKNKFISGVDYFFTKINIVFVVLFRHDWTISLEMFFIIMLWIFTLISLQGYVGCFILKSGIEKFFISLALTIVLAQVKLFYYISIGLTKIFLFKSSIYWRSLSFIALVAGLFIYLVINREISKSIKKRKEKQKIEKLEEKTENLERFRKGIKSAAA